MKTATWLPVFPGFYNTGFDVDEGRINYDIIEAAWYMNLGPFADIIEKDVNNCEASDDAWKEFCKDVAIECVSVVERELKKLGFVTSIVYDNTYSPKEYNFRIDSINCTIEFDPDAAKVYVLKHIKNFRSYLKENFTSYDGFIAWHSNDAEDWLKDWDATMSHTSNCGSVFDFVCENDKFTEDALEHLVMSEVNFNMDIETAIKEWVKEQLAEGNEELEAQLDLNAEVDAYNDPRQVTLEEVVRHEHV